MFSSCREGHGGWKEQLVLWAAVNHMRVQWFDPGDQI